MYWNGIGDFYGSFTLVLKSSNYPGNFIFDGDVTCLGKALRHNTRKLEIGIMSATATARIEDSFVKVKQITHNDKMASSCRKGAYYL